MTLSLLQRLALASRLLRYEKGGYEAALRIRRIVRRLGLEVADGVLRPANGEAEECGFVIEDVEARWTGTQEKPVTLSDADLAFLRDRIGEYEESAGDLAWWSVCEAVGVPAPDDPAE